MKHTSHTVIISLCIGLLSWSGCQKFLDAKPDQQLFIPTKVAELQALLDNYPTMNQNDPYAGEASADNYYLTEADWLPRTAEQRRLYTWAPDFTFPSYRNEWSDAYEGIFVANTVLSRSADLPDSERLHPDWHAVRGQAFFHRARLFAAIAAIWAPAYDEPTADRDLGVALRLTDDFNERSVRASVSATYARILDDLSQATALLPLTAISPMRPNRVAAHALLARVYLSMRRYDEAGRHADTAYRSGLSLLDYSLLIPAQTRPFSLLNAEVLFHAQTISPTLLAVSRAKTDQALYDSFAEGDLRKTCFFQDNRNGTYGFKGNYTGGAGLFTGIASDEVFLTKAECMARSGDTQGSMTVLNELLVSRWQQDGFTPLRATNQAEALEIILQERRKSLIYRGLRWMDIKRLNKEGHGIELVRELGDNRHVLPANDLRYALALPEDLINLSGMLQNPR